MSRSKSSKRKHARRRAREAALSALYSGDIMEADATGIVESGAYPDGELVFSDYAEFLVQGVGAHLADIDAQIVAASENWALDRMPVVDRAILRVAAYEILYVEDVPASVAINEAVELAKAYGGEDESARFVNGVLGRIVRASEETPDDVLSPDEPALANEPAPADGPVPADESMLADAPAPAPEGEAADA